MKSPGSGETVPEAATAPPSRGRTRGPSRLRLLLVEDNPGDAGLVRELLRETSSAEFDIVHVEDMRQGCEALRVSPFDVVLTDLSLPDSEGLQAVMRLRESAPQTPIVVMTGIESEEVDQASAENGVHGYVVKGEMSATGLSRQLRHAIERGRIVRELEEAREEAHRLATRDPLTGLANRLVLEDRLSRLVAAARRHGERIGVLALDLDRFKGINDAFGHDVGDELLRCVASRLLRQVRDSDTVARQGGDEFVILLTNITREMDAARVARKILSTLASPISIHGHDYLTSGSIGIATFPSDGQDPTSLLRAADTAMYHAKREGAGRYQFYREEMTENAIRRLEIERDLRYCIARCELVLFYQPVVELATGELVGVEALARWRHPTRGLLEPDAFLPIAEETGEIVPIGEWVIWEATRQCAEWRRRHQQPLSVSVNVSPRQLRSPGFPRIVEQSLERHGLPRDALTLEIVEGSLVEHNTAIELSLRTLREMEIGIELDDFGTGYSCLAELREIPIRAIKVDRRFIQGLPSDPHDMTIVSTIRHLAGGIGATTIAEGIESQEQLEAVMELGYGFGQGYLFQRPAGPEEIERLLARPRPYWWEKE